MPNDDKTGSVRTLHQAATPLTGRIPKDHLAAVIAIIGLLDELADRVGDLPEYSPLGVVLTAFLASVPPGYRCFLAPERRGASLSSMGALGIAPKPSHACHAAMAASQPTTVGSNASRASRSLHSAK